MPAKEHRRHGKSRVVESVPAQHSLMPLLRGLLLHLAETILMRDRSHDDNNSGSQKVRSIAT